MCTSTLVVSTPGNRHSTLAFRVHPLSSIFIILKFKHTHFGIWPQATKQANKHAHARAQCSHASVELAQACPNYPHQHGAQSGVSYMIPLPSFRKSMSFILCHVQLLHTHTHTHTHTHRRYKSLCTKTSTQAATYDSTR